MAVREVKEYPETRLALDAVAAALQVPPHALRAAIVDKIADAVHRTSARDLTPIDYELLVLFALSERLPTAEECTFFLIGKDIEAHQDEAKAIALAGHQIGNHSYSHERMILKTYGFCKREIEQTDALIRESGFDGRILFRPPYSKKLFTLPLYLKNTGRATILCDVAPEGALGAGATAEQLSDYVIERSGNGSIIVMHAMYKTETIMEAVNLFVPKLQVEGYQFVVLDRLLEETEAAA